ncbi:ALB3A [Auxenochlorella protothecoides x Auxenochlorella symbiontica]
MGSLPQPVLTARPTLGICIRRYNLERVCRPGRWCPSQLPQRPTTCASVGVHGLSGAAEDLAAAATSRAVAQDNGLLEPLVQGLEYLLQTFQSGLEAAHVPHSFGWSIVALTAVVKLCTFPLTKKQVEASLSMQRLKPAMDAIKAKYKEDKKAQQRETQALYKKAEINPLAGCFPSLATIPVFIGLYRSLTGVASLGLLDNQGFYWVPSLAGPTSVAAQRAGTGISWLYPFVDGHPPIGWDEASRYLVIPVLMVIAQYISTAIISPPVDPNNENARTQQIIIGLLPLMVGYFALCVPSGLSLYYLSNTVLTSGQQIFLRKLGGARLTELDLGPLELGTARRSGTAAVLDLAGMAQDTHHSADGSGVLQAVGAAADAFNVMEDASPQLIAALSEEEEEREARAEAAPALNRRCKRRRLPVA